MHKISPNGPDNLYSTIVIDNGLRASFWLYTDLSERLNEDTITVE